MNKQARIPMKRLTTILVSLVVSSSVIGCGEQSAPPAGTPGAGPYTGPPTAGVAQKNREKMFKDLEARAAKAAARRGS
jgi:hypothetical protein